jgi:hypothetical protein
MKNLEDKKLTPTNFDDYYAQMTSGNMYLATNWCRPAGKEIMTEKSAATGDDFR